ncbi:hypothetical protein RJ55_05483 [Drechmeria coniospora]|nr:hypothetical protein RJ55_05483 [Drechmeria coniospora]
MRPFRSPFSSRRQFSTPTTSRHARAFPPLLAFGFLLGGTAYYLATPPARSTTLNGETFVPYTITSRDAISPTSVILTVLPHVPDRSPPYIEPATSRWKHPLWSVEFKQPEVQIARHYTPLPPLHGEDPADGRLRFYVRAVGGGEMSTYLSRLPVGRDVWLRGPHPSFDVLPMLGARTHLVFLAGGTGLVPGMQVADAVLRDRDDTTVTLLWAVRKRGEIQCRTAPTSSWWVLWPRKGISELRADLECPSPIAVHLKEMKTKYGNRLNIRLAVDEEGTRFESEDVRKALAASPTESRLAVSTVAACSIHDQPLQEQKSEFEPAGGACQCAPSDANALGKNLFIISGPDGFISHYAGPKVWRGGTLTQGPVGGVAARLRNRFPQLERDWLLLKL